MASHVYYSGPSKRTTTIIQPPSATTQQPQRGGAQSLIPPLKPFCNSSSSKESASSAKNKKNADSHTENLSRSLKSTSDRLADEQASDKDDKLLHSPRTTAAGPSKFRAAVDRLNSNSDGSKASGLKSILKNNNDVVKTGSPERHDTDHITPANPWKSFQALGTAYSEYGRGTDEQSSSGALPDSPSSETTVRLTTPHEVDPTDPNRTNSTSPPPKLSTIDSGDLSQRSPPRTLDPLTDAKRPVTRQPINDDSKLPSSVVDHHSVTPPPDVSTAPGGLRYKPKRSPTVPILKLPVGGVGPSSIISAAAPSAAEVIMENATANFSAVSPSATSSAISRMQGRASKSSAENVPTPSEEEGTGTSASHSSMCADSAAGNLSRSKWTKLKPKNARDAVLCPLFIPELPPPKVDALLFFSESNERRWYMGFVEEWKQFNSEAIAFWNDQQTRDAFHKARGQPMSPPCAKGTDITKESEGFEILHSWFRCEVLELLNDVTNRLLPSVPTTEVEAVMPGDPADEDIGNDNIVWEPDYVLKAAVSYSQDLETRMLGHAEYLGGKTGALTWAIDECPRNPWGSLRCVLGDIAHHMLMACTRYAFLLSADEIIFLKLDPRQRTEYPPDQEPIDLFVEPWLIYSTPIKMTDVLDEARGTIPVKLAMLYLMHLSTQHGWEVTEDTGSSLNRFRTTKMGEAFVPKFSFIGPDGNVKKLGKY